MRLVVLAAVVVATMSSGVGRADAADAVENNYEASTGVAVTWSDGRALGCADPAAVPPNPYTFVYPTGLGHGPYPILVWGNATGGANSTCTYEAGLRHLASWGFVVVSPNDGSVGSGAEMLAAVNHMVSQNTTPSSVFYGKLDTANIGAFGHSQGAGGAVNATKASGGLIDTVATLAFTDPSALWWWPLGLDIPTTSGLTPPAFFVRGSNDVLATQGGQDGYYNNKPGAAARATLTGADHLNLAGATGYLTAWFMYTLKHDPYARSAFVGSTAALGCAALVKPEICTHTGWSNVSMKSLP